MSWFNKIKKNDTAAVQTAPVSEKKHPFAYIRNYRPLGGFEKNLYRSLRESIPIIDAAIYKIVRLTGGFSVKCHNQNAEKALAYFLHLM